MNINTKQKLVLAWVDMDGFEETGRYRDAMNYHKEFRATPQAKAICWSWDSPERRTQLLAHIEAEKTDHLWMGWFLLPYQNNILIDARAKALEEYKKAKTP